ncbi:MAG: thioredoxin [Gemmatimonadetes bacterium]|nr:thioredoxin [Gemmatimonadota bacterium]
MNGTVDVTDETFQQEVEQHAGLAIVDFWATWCGPCRIIAPVLEDLAARYAGRVKVAKLDVDENQRTPSRYSVRASPTLLFFKDGRVVGQIVGAVPAHRIEAALLEHA